MSDEFEGRTPARKFQRIDILVVGFDLASKAFEVVSDAFASLTVLCAAHANYNVERERFRMDAAHEIETITGEQE